VLAPEGWGPFLSWFCGYYNTFGWAAVVASVVIGLGQFIMAIVILCNPTVTYARWQGFLVYQVVNALLMLVTIYGHKIVPLLNKAGFIICITAFVTINIVLLACAPKETSTFVFATFTNTTGWTSPGMAFIVGLTCPAFSYGG
jgi:choline transport protein